jgi:ABC-2 type transport system ATP-binding protein
MSLLCVNHLTKTFTLGKKSWFSWEPPEVMTAVDDISFELQKGELLGILGANGAGKTTTIAMLLGVLTPTRGTISYFGKDFLRYRSELFQKISFANGYFRLPARLTVWENLDIIGRLYTMPAALRTKKIDEVLAIFGISHLRNRPTGPLSAGQMARLTLAKAFLPDPQVVLLDEPTAPLDPEIAHEVRHFLLQEKKRRGVSFIFTSHNMDEVAYLCDRVLVFKNGRIVANESPKVLAASVQKARLVLWVTEGLEIVLNKCAQQELMVEVQDDKQLTVHLDEEHIARLLIDLARAGVTYIHLQVEKPTLNDYFLQLARQS